MTLLRRDHLLAVDAEVLARLCGPRVTIRPQVISGADVARPAGLHRQARRGRRPSPSQHDFLARRRRAAPWAPCSAPASPSGSLSHASRKPLGGSGSFRSASSLPISRSAVDRVFAPMPSATRCGVPNRLPSTGIECPVGPLEQQRRPARAQHAIADLGHLEARIDLGADALRAAPAFELRDEIAQVGVFHGSGISLKGQRAPS